MGRRHGGGDNRDANEAEIVDALEAAGASVSRLDGKSGEPDLLVGFCCRNELMEVKRPISSSGKTTGGASRRANGGDGVSTRAQLEWRAKWRGMPAVIVSTPEEALRAVGVTEPTEVARCLERAAALAKRRAPAVKRRRSGLITSEEAAAIERIADQAERIKTCGERTRHARVVGRAFCACTHAMFC